MGVSRSRSLQVGTSLDYSECAIKRPGAGYGGTLRAGSGSQNTATSLFSVLRIPNCGRGFLKTCGTIDLPAEPCTHGQSASCAKDRGPWG